MAVELDHIKQVMAEADCLFTEADVEGALDNMAAEIRARLSDSNPIVYSVMNGGLIISGNQETCKMLSILSNWDKQRFPVLG